ncbi:F0F1 ATP synthase subunit delta [Angustibacter peucedani]
MQGASRESLAAAREQLDALLARAGADGVSVGTALHAVVDLLDANVSLRRALTDPSHQGEAKAALVGRLLDGKASADVVELLGQMVRGRWSRARDLADALEQLAGAAVVAGAEQADRADRVEDELFRFERVVDADPRLARALADRAAPASSKAALLDDLLREKAAPETRTLVHRVVLSGRERNLDRALDGLVELAAARREQLVAHVKVALPLTDDHRTRLVAALGQLYGKAVHLNVDVDPHVLGGIRVEIGDEVLDGTVARKLDDVRRRMAR